MVCWLPAPVEFPQRDEGRDVDDWMDWEAWARARLERMVVAMTAQLRSIADRIDVEARFNIKRATGRATDHASYLRVAQAVVHEISWGVANLDLSSVISAAADAHNAQQEKIVRADQPADPARVLTEMWKFAQSWAQTAAEDDEAMGHPDRKPADQQEFQLADIKAMIQETARIIGVEVDTDATA